jgi:hypothetical protein
LGVFVGNSYLCIGGCTQNATPTGRLGSCNLRGFYRSLRLQKKDTYVILATTQTTYPLHPQLHCQLVPQPPSIPPTSTHFVPNSYVGIFITHTINHSTKHNSQDGAKKASYLPLPTLQRQLIFDPPKTMAAPPFLISLLMPPPTTFITAITFINVSYHEGHHYFIIFLPPPSHPLPSLQRFVVESIVLRKSFK